MHSMGKFEKSLSMLSWVYNEEALVNDFVQRLDSLLKETVEDYEIIIVNDGSTDSTGERLRNLQTIFPALLVVENDSNRNVAYSLKKALALATKDYVTWQTADWSYCINHIRIHLELLRSYDAVLGIRPVPASVLSGIPVIRRVHQILQRSDNVLRAIQSLTYYYLIRVLFGLPFNDTQGIHYHKTKTLQALNLHCNSVFIGIEMLTRLYSSGSRFIEIPIPFVPRSGGSAKGGRIGFILKTFTEIFHQWLAWGIRERKRYSSDKARQVFRLTDAYHLEEEIIRLVAPLFKYFR